MKRRLFDRLRFSKLLQKGWFRKRVEATVWNFQRKYLTLTPRETLSGLPALPRHSQAIDALILLPSVLQQYLKMRSSFPSRNRPGRLLAAPIVISWCHAGCDLKQLRSHNCYHLHWNAQTFLRRVDVERTLMVLATVLKETCGFLRFVERCWSDQQQGHVWPLTSSGINTSLSEH